MLKKRLKSALETYRKMSEPKKAGIWFVVCSFLQKGISLITVPIFTRIMSTTQYGIFSVYQSWYSILSIFATLNLWLGVFNNGMLDFKDKQETFVSSIQGLCTTITCCTFVVYLLFQDRFNSLFGLPSFYICTMFVELLFTPAFSLWCAYQRFQYRYVAMVIITLIMSLAAPLIGMIAVSLTEYKAEARVVSFVAVQVLTGAILYYLNLRKGKKFVSLDIWKYAFLFNIALVPHYLSSVVLTSSDRVMINNMVGPDKAAIYSVVYNVSSIVNLITTAIANAYTPFAYQNMKAGTLSKIKDSSKKLIIFMAVFCIVIMLLGPEVISFFAPSQYYEAIWIIPPVIAASYFFFLYPMFNIVEFYYKKNIYVTIASCVGAALNIALNYVMIPSFGYIAAGYTTLVSYIAFSVAHYHVSGVILKKHRINILEMYDKKEVIIISLILLLMMGLSLVLYKNAILRGCTIVSLLFGLCLKRKEIIDTLKKVR